MMLVGELIVKRWHIHVPNWPYKQCAAIKLEWNFFFCGWNVPSIRKQQNLMVDDGKATALIPSTKREMKKENEKKNQYKRNAGRNCVFSHGKRKAVNKHERQMRFFYSLNALLSHSMQCKSNFTMRSCNTPNSPVHSTSSISKQVAACICFSLSLLSIFELKQNMRHKYIQTRFTTA